MTLEETPINGLKIIHPQVFNDERGFFMETYNEVKFENLGVIETFRQDNHSRSTRNTLRGLHFQSHPGQAKLVRAIRGVIWDVAVDIRLDSPTFGKWFGIELSEDNKTMFFIPIGFAHGFCVLSDVAEVAYKASNVYNAQTECGIAWDDPDIAIEWPVSEPILSNRDLKNPSLKEWREAQK